MKMSGNLRLAAHFLFSESNTGLVKKHLLIFVLLSLSCITYPVDGDLGSIIGTWRLNSYLKETKPDSLRSGNYSIVNMEMKEDGTFCVFDTCDYYTDDDNAWLYTIVKQTHGFWEYDSTESLLFKKNGKIYELKAQWIILTYSTKRTHIHYNAYSTVENIPEKKTRILYTCFYGDRIEILDATDFTPGIYNREDFHDICM